MMNEKPRIRRQSVFFFVILYILAAWIIWSRTAWLRPLSTGRILALLGGLALTAAAAPFLTPLFSAIMALTRRLGSMLFAVISLLVYFIILTPIAVVLRLSGKRFLPPDGDDLPTWYEKWDPGHAPDKQY